MSRYRTRFLVVVSFLLLPLLSGCLPTVVWLPDNSGFIYTERGWRRVVHYDLKSKTRKVLVEDTQTRTFKPAISPDGKQFAVGGVYPLGGGKFAVQIVTYDLEGKETARSPFFGVEEGTKIPVEPWPTLLMWLTTGDIAIHGYNNKEETESQTWLYQAKQTKLIGPVQQDTVPWLMGGGVDPDGAGYFPNLGGDEVVQFTTWEGKAQPIPGLREQLEELEELDGNTLPSLKWEGTICTLSYPSANVIIDIAKQKSKIAYRIRSYMVNKKEQSQVHLFPDSSARLVWADRNLLYQEVKKETSTTLIGKQAALLPLSPAPNGKLVAVRTLISNQDTHKPGDKGEQIAVVNEEGKVVDSLEVFTSIADYGVEDLHRTDPIPPVKKPSK